MRYNRIQEILTKGFEEGRITQQEVDKHNELWASLESAENKDNIMKEMNKILAKADPDGSISQKLQDKELESLDIEVQLEKLKERLESLKVSEDLINKFNLMVETHKGLWTASAYGEIYKIINHMLEGKLEKK